MEWLQIGEFFIKVSEIESFFLDNRSQEYKDPYGIIITMESGRQYEFYFRNQKMRTNIVNKITAEEQED
jgi:hypothetical protein